MIWGEGGRPNHLVFAGLRGSGKGGSKPATTTSSSQVQIPDWLSAAAQGAVGTAQDLSQRPYEPYTGQIVAQPGADTANAYQAVRNMQGQYDPAFQQAGGQWAGVLPNLQSLTPDQQSALTNQLFGNYQQGVINPAAGLLGGYMAGGPATAQQVANNALTIMSPYSQAVIDPALQIGKQQLAENLQTIGAGANQAGAFGGSRQGVMEGVAQAQAALGAGQTVGQLLQQGWNTAMNPAQALALQQGAQGYGAAGALAGMYGTGYGNAAAQAANMAGTNLQLGVNAAGQLPALATAQQAADQKNASLLQTIGAAQQAQQQTGLNVGLGQFYEQRDYPIQNLDILLSALGGVPYGYDTSGGTQQQQYRNPLTGALGGASAGASIASLMGASNPYIGGAAAIGGLLGGLG